MQKALILIITFLVLHVNTNDIERTISYGLDDVAAIWYFKNKSIVTIKCERRLSLSKVSEERGPLDRHLRVNSLELYNCLSSKIPYGISLKKLNISVIEKLSIFVPEEPQLNATHFDGLTIKILKLGLPREEEGSTLHPSPDFLEPLEMLSELEVYNTALPPLPNKSRIVKVTLRNGNSLNQFGECSELKKLDITQWEVSTEEWLMHCPKLTTLLIKSSSIHVLKRILAKSRSIRSLTIRESYNLECLKDRTSCHSLFNDLVNLQSLDLSSNGIHSVEETVFEHLKSLIDLNLSGNEFISSWDLVKSLEYLQNLTSLTLDQNKFNKEWCNYFNVGQLPKKLQRLSLVAIGATELCGRIMVRKNLELLDMTSNNIETLQFEMLLSLSRRVLPFTIDLRNNPLRKFELTEKYYYELKENPAANLTVIIDPAEIECDCEHKWLAQTVRDCPHVNVSGIRCNNGHTLGDIPLASIECEKYDCSRPGCVCKKWSNGTVDAYCSDPGPWPNIPQLRKLNVSDTGIKILYANDLSASLQFIDLSKNSLSHLSSEVASALFAVPTRIVRLSGNPLACDCNNQALIAALQTHHEKVEDYKEVMCAGDELAVREVTVPYLCELENQQKELMTALVASGVLATFAISGLVLHQRYKREIRVFLHARGWCLCLFREDDEDERPYDVFLSFSHHDEQLVVEELLPKLEEEPYEYKVCVHYRDWIAGEWIPMQIARSVQLSRRTLVVVSNSFLDSMWGLLEFRTAMMSSARDGQPRVVIVLLDEELVRDSRIDPELRAYLNTNTYLCWADPSFWDKLYYALPHRRRKHKQISPSSTSHSSTVELTFTYTRGCTE